MRQNRTVRRHTDHHKGVRLHGADDAKDQNWDADVKVAIEIMIILVDDGDCLNLQLRLPVESWEPSDGRR